MSNLPAYVNRPTGYALALPGPYFQKNVTMRGYVLDAHWGKLRDTCRRYLTDPGTEYDYEPLWGAVLLTMLNMERVSATPDSLGYMHEIDGAFQIPVLRFPRGSWLPDSVAVFMPYLWVNSDWPLVTGRESLGFRKGLGTSFTAGDDDQASSAADLTHIEGWVIPAAGQKLVKQRIVEIHHDPSAARTGATWSTPHQAFDAVLERLLGETAAHLLSLLARLLGELKLTEGLRVPMAFLKQLRDAAQAERAAYQMVLQSDGFVPVGGVRGGGLLSGKHSVTVRDFISHPLREELGLPSGTADVPVQFAFELDFDFEMRLP